MTLYLMRHGEYLAGTEEEALSPQGKATVEALAKELRQANLTVEKIWHSGKRRTLETADIIAQGFSGEVRPMLRSGIKPNDDASQFAAELNFESDDLMIVSHLPFLSRLVGQLVVQNENRELINFQPGTIVCLERLDEEKWLIRWVW